MSCGNCGNGGCGGCGGCSRLNVSQVALTPVCTSGACGTCSSSSCSGGCGSNPATPTPYYQATPQCQENHCQEVVNNYYASAICSTYAANMPECGGVVNIYFVDVKVLPVGNFLWNENVGYLEVVAFNSQTGLATLLNNCNEGNIAAGTAIPACTCFTVSAPPCCSEEDPTTPFVAEDFTAPADASCTTITVTSVAGLAEGDLITIGSGIYLLDNILTPTTIEICNEGDGITPGTVVEARNEAGELQYPIVSITNCCDVLRDELAQTSDEDQSALATDTLTVDEDSAETTPIVLTVTNNSTTENMLVTGIFSFYSITIPLAAAGIWNYDIQLSENGGAYTGFLGPVFGTANPYQLGNNLDSISNTLTFSKVYTIAPAAVLTVAVKGIMTSEGAVDIGVQFFVKGTLVGTAI